MGKQDKTTIENIKRLEGYFSLREAAHELGITKEAVRLHIKKGTLKSVKQIDGFYLISIESINRLVNQLRQSTDKRKQQLFKNH